MARRVVTGNSPRCERCRFSPRWCLCSAFESVESPVAVDVLFHRAEVFKPTSTGDLINRVVAGSGRHIYDPFVSFNPDALQRPGKEMWVLHPLGEPMPTDVPAAGLQLVLLDGNWRQAGEMMRALEGRGRRIQLPMTGESRYRLRTQSGEGKFCTVEALIFLLEALGFTDAAALVRRQFELHVYAGLLTRGKVIDAEAYLAASPVAGAFPDLVQRLKGKADRDPV